MITLETDRLILRMLQPSDLDAYAEMCGDPEVMRFIAEPLDRPAAWRNMAMMLGHWTLRGYGQWALEEKATSRLIGRAGFWNPEGWPGFELGWMLRRSCWGRGFATEAAHAALEHAFTHLSYDKVISLIHPDNAASIKVAERLGERRHGVTDLFGKSVLVYRITKAEWENEQSR